MTDCRDTVVVVPTGYGKSAILQCSIWYRENSSLVGWWFSPLNLYKTEPAATFVGIDMQIFRNFHLNTSFYSSTPLLNKFMIRACCIWWSRDCKCSSIRLILVPKIRPREHKLRKYLSLKSYFEYLKFYWTHCDNNFQIWTKCTFKHILKNLVH